jgi:hypothetical protein
MCAVMRRSHHHTHMSHHHIRPDSGDDVGRAADVRSDEARGFDLQSHHIRTHIHIRAHVHVRTHIHIRTHI